MLSKSNKTKHSAFTLIELLVVIAIIAILSTLSVVALGSARAKAREAKRLSDIRNIQTSLALYYNEYGVYPSASIPEDTSTIFCLSEQGISTTCGTIVYLAEIPTDPADGFNYSYTPTSSFSSYAVAFTLTSGSGGYEAGNYIATPDAIIAVAGEEGTIYAVGDTGPGGGYVFYITAGGYHGIEASFTDQTIASWSLPGYSGTLVGGTTTTIGSGAANTDKIIVQNGAGTYAASLARAYTGGGMNDWYLPSKDELALLYNYKATIGGFITSPLTYSYYWSSSESSNTNAHMIKFSDGTSASGGKTRGTPTNVRAVRSF
jgi:prepilin-type N-terminal cleavage/methylation domain-containing protein